MGHDVKTEYHFGFFLPFQRLKSHFMVALIPYLPCFLTNISMIAPIGSNFEVSDYKICVTVHKRV